MTSREVERQGEAEGERALEEPLASPARPGVAWHNSVRQMVQMRQRSGLTGANVEAFVSRMEGSGPARGGAEHVHHAAREGIKGASQALPHGEAIQRSFGGFDVSGVKAHVGGAAASASAAMGAHAYAVGDHVAFAQAPDLHTAAHEAAHVVQQRGRVQLKDGIGEAGDLYERHADEVADLVVRGQSAEAILAQLAPSGAGRGGDGALQMDPLRGALSVARRLAQWIGREGVTKQISKHVARHGRRMAGRAVHTVFRNPNRIRDLVREASEDALRLAAANSTRAADEVLEGAGIRMARQAAGPGKFRWVIDKDFGRAIGTQGETVLRIVVDVTGRIVTAFPRGAMGVAGLGAASTAIFTSGTAEAGERVQEAVEEDERARQRREDESFWGDLLIDFVSLPLSILLSASPANEGEGLQLEIHRITQEVFAEMLPQIEAEEQRELSQEERAQLRELLWVSVGAAMMVQDDEEEE